MRRPFLQALLIVLVLLIAASRTWAQPYEPTEADWMAVRGSLDASLHYWATGIFLAGFFLGWVIYGELRRGGGMWSYGRSSSSL